MKLNFLKVLSTAVVAMTALLACNKENQSGTPLIGIMSGEYFSSDNTAEITLVLSDAPKNDLSVNLVVSGTALPETTALPGDHISLPSSVTVVGGATSTSFTATVNPEGLADGTYSAGIQIQPGSGYKVSEEGAVTYIKLTVTGQGGGSGSSLQLQSNWSVSLLGDPYEYEDDLYIDLSVNLPGIQYFFMEANTEEDMAEYYNGTIEGLVAKWEADNLTQLETYSINQILFSLQDEEFYTAYYGEGPAKIYIVEFDAQGKATGRYGVSDVVMPPYDESGQGGGDTPSVDITMTLQNDWTLTITGSELVRDDYGSKYLAATVSAPGSSYIYIDSYTDQELESDASGDIANVAAQVQTNLQSSLGEGSTINELLYQAGNVYVPYYEGGETWFYILDFDANGKATGKYGKVKINVPDLSFTPVLNGPLTFQSAWKAAYGGREDGYDRIDISGVTDSHFMFDLYNEVIPDNELQDELINLVAFNINEYGYVYDGPEDYDNYNGLSAGTYYVYIVGLDEGNNLTGNYGYSTISVTSTSSVNGAPHKRIGRSATVPARLHSRTAASAPVTRKIVKHTR